MGVINNESISVLFEGNFNDAGVKQQRPECGMLADSMENK